MINYDDTGCQVPSIDVFSCISGGLNDCSSCQGGSSGVCLPDSLKCQKPRFIPWDIVCKAVYNDKNKNKVWEDAGKDGCRSCGTRYHAILSRHCATTCNWCTQQNI